MRQEVRFCTTADGVRLAYAVSGKGPPLVRAPHWFTHLEHDWTNPAVRPSTVISTTYSYDNLGNLSLVTRDKADSTTSAPSPTATTDLIGSGRRPSTQAGR